MKQLSDKKFLEYVEKKVRSTIRKYKLLNPKEKICVAVSGGKDSTACLIILKKLGYTIEAITIDPGIIGYYDNNLKNIKKICKENKITINVKSFKKEFGKDLSELKEKLKKKGYDHSYCMICGIMKRYMLNKYGKKLNFDKLATGHNLDDEAQAFMMNVFRNDFSKARRQGPVAGAVKSDKFVSRIKPLYEITENEIIRYTKILKLPINYEICPYSGNAYRRKFIRILDEFQKNHPNVKYNILRFHERFKKELPEIKEKEIEKCLECGEPSSGKICKACQIIEEMK